MSYSDEEMVQRAQGCMLGQLAGDALGSLVEFQTAEEIKQIYPDGVCKLADGGTWNTIAGQPTDDSEMALLLARALVEQKTYNRNIVRDAYVFWLESEPFDRGMTISRGLSGRHDNRSQANGAMMRISPLGIFGANFDLTQVAEWARMDATLTHPNKVCVQANALFTMAIASAVKNEISNSELYHQIVGWAEEMDAEASLLLVIKEAANDPPGEYVYQQGWVLIAFQNALWQLLHAENFEAGVIDTVMRGGDTDTNAAICGALLGAIYGIQSVPEQWQESILNCRPEKGKPNVLQPRPECFWPVDGLELAEKLLMVGQK